MDDRAKLISLCGQYAKYLEKRGIRARIPCGGEDELYAAQPPATNLVALSHIAWMMNAAARMEPDSINKAMRWLGFIQGVLWCFGAFSIGALRRHWTEGSVKEEH